MIDDDGIPQSTLDRDQLGRAKCADAGEVWDELTEAGRERWRREADAAVVEVNTALAIAFSATGRQFLPRDEDDQS